MARNRGVAPEFGMQLVLAWIIEASQLIVVDAPTDASDPKVLEEQNRRTFTLRVFELHPTTGSSYLEVARKAVKLTG